MNIVDQNHSHCESQFSLYLYRISLKIITISISLCFQHQKFQWKRNRRMRFYFVTFVVDFRLLFRGWRFSRFSAFLVSDFSKSLKGLSNCEIFEDLVLDFGSFDDESIYDETVGLWFEICGLFVRSWVFSCLIGIWILNVFFFLVMFVTFRRFCTFHVNEKGADDWYMNLWIRRLFS